MPETSILIVDNHVEYAETLARLARDNGWSAITASSGDEALQVLQTNKVDILASDYVMGDGINGAELIRRAMAFKPDLYSIVFTGYYNSRRAYAIRSLEVGASAYLAKDAEIYERFPEAIRRGIQAMTLSRIGRSLLDLTEEREILTLALHSIARIAHFDGCCLAVRGDGHRCRVEQAFDLGTRTDLPQTDITDPDSAYRYAIDEQHAYFPPLFAPAGKNLLPFLPGAKSIVVVPLTLKGGERGALGVEHGEENRLGIEDLRFLNQIASWVSLAMERLTQQERLQVEKERSVERRDLLARAALHEIKNPLNNLSTAVQVAAERVDPETRTALLDNVTRINRAVNTVLRPLIRDENSPREALPVDGIIQDAVARFRLYHPSDTMRLTEAIAPALPRIVGHRAMLVSALVNVLENGAKATETASRPPEIRLSAMYVSARDRVEVVVNDNGCGIPRDLIDRVFDYGVTSQKQEGHTGYGLAFTKDIVGLSGGQISVRSTGEGTTFTLSFPVGRDEQAAAEGR